MTARHTADLRSEKNLSQTTAAKYARAEYLANQTKQMCVRCKIVEIGGSRKSYCYDCSAYQVNATASSGLRRVMREIGVEVGATTLTPEQQAAVLAIFNKEKK
jgi:hypothetical protein